MSLGQKELQALSQSVQHASDRTIIQVVAAIDSIENRGDADTLLVPLRGRIAGLKIKRPLTLRRLTYEPLEPLIVDTTAWVSGQPAVPRSALSSLFEMIKAASPDMPDWEQLAAKAQINRRMREELGLRLWGRGAQVLVQAGMPARWPDMTGLSAEDFNRIAGIVALVLSQAANLRLLDAARGEDHNDPLLRRILGAAWTSTPLSRKAMIAILTGNHALVPMVARLGQEMGTPAEVRAGTAAQIAESLGFQFSQALNAGPAALQELAELADTIGDLEASAGMQGELRQAADRLREDARAQCEAALNRAVDAGILPVLRQGKMDQAALRGLESEARKLRALGMICERFGSTEAFDAASGKAVAALSDPACGLPVVSRARLLEQLGRHEDAFALVKPAADQAGEDDGGFDWEWAEESAKG